MRKKLIGIFLSVSLLVVALLGVTLMGCNENNGEKITYSVTVLDPDRAPVNGVLVYWMQGDKEKGSATTDANGKAEKELNAGVYKIELANYDTGLTYTSVSVTDKMSSIRLTLSYRKLLYTTTVTDKNGSPAEGVTVTWMSGTTSAGSAVTNANGVAEKELNFGDYTVIVNNLPAGNIAPGSLQATGDSPAITFALVDGQLEEFTVTVATEGKLPFADQDVTVTSNGATVESGKTDENGVVKFNLPKGGTYAVNAVNLPEGYTCAGSELSAEIMSTELTLVSKVVRTRPASDQVYVIGDIIYNFSFTTAYDVDGLPVTYQIADLLEKQNKKAVLINNWGTNCSWCVKEMPAMQEVYEKYKDDIEMIAVSNYMGGDSDAAIIRFREENNITFPMMRDEAGIASHFYLTGWPTTIVIDRYGAVARIESGAVTDAEVWERMIDPFIADDYRQTFVRGQHTSPSINEETAKPDVEISADHYDRIAEVINNTEMFPDGASVRWYGETEYEYAWPFILKDDPAAAAGTTPEQVLASSNVGKANSMSILYGDVTVGAGQVFTFDYYADTEATYDALSIVWDGKVIREISGKSNGWQTCYLYADLTDGAHELALTYMKDNTTSEGLDNVYLRNFRFVSINQIESADMLRGAAYGELQEDDKMFPYYATVGLGEDGYYHVDRTKLENPEYAGNDDSPLLFASFLQVTNFANNATLQQLLLATDEKSGKYIYSCTFAIGDEEARDHRAELNEYIRVAGASDIHGFVPVDELLRSLLIGFLKNVSGAETHENEWLEVCYFYSHYGSGSPVGDPTIGLSNKTAIEIEVPTANRITTQYLTRNMSPFPATIYTFTPKTSGVYKFESFLSEADGAKLSTQMWLYDEETNSSRALAYGGDDTLNRDGKNEYNFVVYRYLEANHKYYLTVAFRMADTGEFEFSVTNEGDSVTALSPASLQRYTMTLDEQGQMTGYELAGAIGYKAVDEGGKTYYRSVNPDGSTGDYIYLDFKYPSAIIYSPLSTAIDLDMRSPVDNETSLGFKMFDFTKRIAYSTNSDGSSSYRVITLEGDEKYKDYTEILREYLAEANANDGLVKVDQQLVDILTLFFELRVNMLLDNMCEQALENEWLRFCWYNRVYDVNNP